MDIITFSSDFTSSKVPKSPFGDLTFEFVSNNVDLKGALDLLRENFVLNRNYKIPKTIRCRKTKVDLSPYLRKKMSFLILDLDNIKSKYSENMIIDFFKKKDYYVGLIPSRSYNGVDKFNLKGVMKVTGDNNKASIKKILKEVQGELFEYTKIDLSSLVESAHQAPTFSEETLLFQEGSNIPCAYEPNEKEEYPDYYEDKFQDPDTQEVLNICLNEFKLRGFSVKILKKEENLIIFSHPSEKSSRKGYFLYLNNPFFMNHFNKEKSFSIFSDVKSNPIVKSYLKKARKQERIKEFGGVGVLGKSIKINSRYIKVTKKETDLIKEWLSTNGLFKLKSAMGTGKSKVIEEAVKISKENDKKVLIITNRISVAKDFKHKYKMKIYSDGDYEIGDNLIVQFDSLWRYSLKHFDIVILDEFVSVMLHSRNSMGDYGNLNRVKLMYAMRNKTCMIADAFLFGLEDSLITTKPIYSLMNSYREDLVLLEYTSVSSIIQQSLEIAKSEKKVGRKISLSCTSKSLVKAIEKIFNENGLKTMLLTADTLEDDKNLIYDYFEKESHNIWDVLIYTPTLTVGISNLNQTAHHFHIDESTTADVISSLQMIRRTRKADYIHYYVKSRNRILETNVEVLNQEISNNVQKFYKSNNSLLIEIDEFGDFKLSETAIFINLIEIIYNKFENDHSHSFKLLLGHQVSNKPGLMNKINPTFDINEIKKKIKNEEAHKLKNELDKMCESSYDETELEEWKKRYYVISDQDKVKKIMIEVKENLKNDVDLKTLKEITEFEISQKFKFVNKLKKLKFFLTKSELDVKELLSYLVSNNISDKNQLQYFKYVLALKKNDIKLKNKITNIEIFEVDKKIGWGEFRIFLTKIGYKKRGGVYFLGENFLKFSKFIK